MIEEKKNLNKRMKDEKAGFVWRDASVKLS